MTNLLAQDGIPISPDGGFKGFGRLGLESELATNADIVFSDLLSMIIGVITIVAIIWFVFLVITGGYAFMTAGSDKGQIESARKKLANGLTGLIVVIFGIFVVRLVGYLIGIPNILNITDLINIVSNNVVK